MCIAGVLFVRTCRVLEACLVSKPSQVIGVPSRLSAMVCVAPTHCSCPFEHGTHWLKKHHGLMTADLIHSALPPWGSQHSTHRTLLHCTAATLKSQGPPQAPTSMYFTAPYMCCVTKRHPKEPRPSASSDKHVLHSSIYVLRDQKTSHCRENQTKNQYQ